VSTCVCDLLFIQSSGHSLPPSLPPSLPYLVNLRPKPLLQSLLGLVECFVVLEPVQVGHHPHDLGEAVRLRDGREEGGREVRENGTKTFYRRQACKSPRDRGREGRSEGGGRGRTCSIFRNSKVSISKPKDPSTINSTRSAVLARSSIAQRSSEGHSKKVIRLVLPATTVMGPKGKREGINVRINRPKRTSLFHALPPSLPPPSSAPTQDIGEVLARVVFDQGADKGRLSAALGAHHHHQRGRGQGLGTVDEGDVFLPVERKGEGN